MTPSTIVGCLALLAAAVGIGVANASLALPALVVMAVYALMNIYLTRMIGAWMERWLANRRFREIFSMLMALFAVGIQFLNLQRGPMRAPGTRSSWLLAVLHSSGSYLYWLPSGFAAQAILLGEASPGGACPICRIAGQHRAVRGGICGPAAQTVSRRVPERGREPARIGDTGAARKELRTLQPVALSAPASSSAFVSPIVAACLRKEWLVLRGNGTQLIGLLTPLMFVVIFSMNRAFSAFSSKYFLPAAIAYVLIATLSSLYNIFGADGRGVQVYLLAPIRMLDVVLAKNLMSLALIVTQVGLAWTIICVAGASARASVDANLHGIVDDLRRGHESGHWNPAIDPGAAPICSGAGEGNCAPLPPIAPARCWFWCCCSEACCCRFP